MRPDVLVTWPWNADYPLWRQFIHDNRSKFGQVIIVFMNPNHGDDYRDFVIQTMVHDNCLFLESPNYSADQDWRDVAVKEGLKHTTADWVWFTEQDFFPVDEFFWTDVGTKAEFNNIVAVGVGGRMHPCCILIKSMLLDYIDDLDFGILPGVLDHFGKFQLVCGPWIHVEKSSYKHYNGLTHNFSLVQRGEKPNYKADEFNSYLRQCLEVAVPLDDRFVEMVERYLITAE